MLRYSEGDPISLVLFISRFCGGLPSISRTPSTHRGFARLESATIGRLEKHEQDDERKDRNDGGVNYHDVQSRGELKSPAFLDEKLLIPKTVIPASTVL